MKELSLAKVPEREFQAPAMKPTHSWQSAYNVAAWIKLSGVRDGRVKLVLRFTDAQGEKREIVDQCEPQSDGVVLLSSLVKCQAVGPIKAMELLLVSSVNGVLAHAEEVFVQRKQETISDIIAA